MIDTDDLVQDAVATRWSTSTCSSAAPTRHCRRISVS